MYAMQYQITLPADYDMNIIRQRVANNGHRLDQFPGLGLKTFLIREQGVNGSPVNEYAPFYLWASLTGMTNFLWEGGGFSGILSSFGRPAVQNWTGVIARRGSAYDRKPTHATRYVEALPAHSNPQTLVEELRAESQSRAMRPNVNLIAYGIDVRHWELVRFTLWSEAPTDNSDRYDILHVCRPHLDEILDDGRHAG